MGRLALNGFAALVAAFFVLPILAIVPAAFNQQSFIRLPPDSWSLRWWGVFFSDVSWRRALDEPEGRLPCRLGSRWSSGWRRRSASHGCSGKMASAGDRPVPRPGHRAR